MAAMAKWPNVPHCFDWLGLDARGQWFMRDERVQAAGPFSTHKGSRIDHPKLLAFIERNYTHDGAGAWYFQNGPQRVYVELQAAPWVWRMPEPGAVAAGLPLPLTSHTGVATVAQQSWLDEAGRLFLSSPLGLGLVHTQDMHHAADFMENGALAAPLDVQFAALPGRFGFCLSPAVHQAVLLGRR